MISVILSSKAKDFQWVDIVEPTPDDFNQIASDFTIHKMAIQDCLDAQHLPKYEIIDNITLIMLRSYDEHCTNSASTVRELTRKVAVFVGDGFIITIRRKNQAYFSEIIENWKANTEDKDLSPRILTSLVYGALNSYEAPINECQNKLEEFELKIFSSDHASEIIQEKFIEKRKAYVFKRMLKLIIDILPKLKIIEEFSHPIYQDLREHASSLFFYSEDLIEHANNLINLHISLASHNTNRLITTLTLFSVFFMPLTFIVGIYGMNFEYMPELRLAWGYPAVMLIMLLISLSLFLWFKHKGWIKCNPPTSLRSIG